MKIRHAFVLLIISVFLSSIGNAVDRPVKPVVDLPEIAELPNPFTFNDGSPVKTQDDWSRRREELKDLFQNYMYGHLPSKPEQMTIDRDAKVTDEENKITIQNLDLVLEQDGKTLTMHVTLILPANAKGPSPVVIQSGFGKLPNNTQWIKFFTPFTSRGYAVAQLIFVELAADDKEQARNSGIYELFGSDIDCGGLMAWAWGMHRVIDALEKEDSIDSRKIIVTGHSRYGKASLVAGAFDERITLTVPSHSGCAGSSPYRFIYGKSEQLHNIVNYAPQWFRPDFGQFIDRVKRLPVDQHLLLALVAPRALLQTEGTQDDWTNPEGAQLTHLAAKKVYEFLNAEDRIGIRYRPVGHIPSNDDLMDYADHVFFQKPISDEFGKLAYPEEKNALTWDCPK